MAVSYLVPSRRGSVTYTPQLHDHDSQPLRRASTFQPRQFRRAYIYTHQVPGLNSESLLTPRRHYCRSDKLASLRDNLSLRFLQSVISNTPKNESLQGRPSLRESSRSRKGKTTPEGMPGSEFLRYGGPRPLPSHLQRPATQSNQSLARPAMRNSRSTSIGTATSIPEEKPVAVGHGVSVSIHLAEPMLFVQGYDIADSSHRNTAMLRGSLHLNVAKSTKLKAVTLKFRGIATTHWPEGALVLHYLI